MQTTTPEKVNHFAEFRLDRQRVPQLPRPQQNDGHHQRRRDVGDETAGNARAESSALEPKPDEDRAQAVSGGRQQREGIALGIARPECRRRRGRDGTSRLAVLRDSGLGRFDGTSGGVPALALRVTFAHGDAGPEQDQRDPEDP